MKNDNMEYKKRFEWVANQIRQELEWTTEDLIKDPMDAKLLGMKFAYTSILQLVERLEEKGVDGYDEECRKVYEKYKDLIIKEEK